jgi:autotransporter-associated beta strand protein
MPAICRAIRPFGSSRFTAAALAVAAILAAAPLTASAANVTWTGAVNGNWSTAGNWVGGVAPASGDGVEFSGTTSTTYAITNDIGPISIAGLIIAPGAGPYDIDVGGATNLGTYNARSTAGPTSATNMVIAGSLGFTVIPSATATLSSISGTAGRFKNGSGTLIFSGSNSYSGAITHNVGTIINNSYLPAPITVFSAGAVVAGSGTFASITTVLGTAQPGPAIDSIGVLSSLGNITLSATSGVRLQVSAAGQGTGYDALIASGTMDYASGVLTLDSLPGSAFANGSSFQLFGAGAFLGNLGSLTAATTYAGETLTFTGPGAGGEWTTGALTNGQTFTFTPSTGVLAVVPEPTTCASLLAGLACGGYSLFRRRRAR